MSEIFDAVAQLGFPIVVSIFLLWWVTSKLNGNLDRLIQAMDKLPDRIADRIRDLLDETRRQGLG